MAIKTPHDLFFRRSFGRPEVARGYLQAYLPVALRDSLDLTELALEESNFVDEVMKAHQTDLLYKTRLHNGSTAYIYFLFEHKSYVDQWVILQLLRYMLRFWEWQREANVPLSPIIPLLVYHGEKKWQVSTEFHDLFDLPEEIRPYIPSFQYDLTDLSYASDETIRGDLETRVTTAVLRAILNPHLSDTLPTLIDLVLQLRKKETGVEYNHSILYYLSEATERVSRDELEKVLLEHDRKGESTMATIAQEYIQEGIEIGMERGIERGMKEKRDIARKLLKLHGVVTVSEITGLSIDEVVALQEEDRGE